MLSELRVRDLAVIADVTLKLGPGLTELPGKTGGGEEMVVGGLERPWGEGGRAG